MPRQCSDDDRYLWPYMFKAIDQIRPTWIVAENVAGITTMVEQGEVSQMGGQASMFEEVDGLHRYRLAETFTLQRICDDLEGHGYSVQPVLVPACAVGAPHRRDRVFIVARRSTSDTCDNERDGMCRASGKEWEIREERENVEIVHEERHRMDLYTDIERIGEYRTPSNTDRRRLHGLQFVGRWDSFPTVSPVHRGNDGLPFDVDGLSISFSKWRTESFKAYGNAIVPQVMYEIFRAIELVEITQ